MPHLKIVWKLEGVNVSLIKFLFSKVFKTELRVLLFFFSNDHIAIESTKISHLVSAHR